MVPVDPLTFRLARVLAWGALVAALSLACGSGDRNTYTGKDGRCNGKASTTIG